jgi:DNA-binding GntR family transcriptional regulator
VQEDGAVSGSTLKRAKTSHAVVDHLHREVFEGRLRPGDRLDVEAIAARLGVSPTPVREALVLVQRDGLVTSTVHRSTYVEDFDVHTLRADFHVLGLLSGVAVGRIANDRDPLVLVELRRLLGELEAAPSDRRDRINEIANEIVRVEHENGSTPRLRAELQGMSGFLRFAAEASDRRSHPEIVDAHRRVIDAIAAGAPKRASAARLDEMRGAAEAVIADFLRRGVLADEDSAATA